MQDTGILDVYEIFYVIHTKCSGIISTVEWDGSEYQHFENYLISQSQRQNTGARTGKLNKVFNKKRPFLL